MNVQPLAVQQNDALLALREYRQHRDVYDKRDWEIERIYRAISKGKVVISVNDAIRRAGLDAEQRPKLAIARADSLVCSCNSYSRSRVEFSDASWNLRRWNCLIPWADFPSVKWWRLQAQTPRIPPQHRPTTKTLDNYHILWEADWTEIPRDPYLLKRIGKDAWVVLAAWDLTEVELSVLRAHQ